MSSFRIPLLALALTAGPLTCAAQLRLDVLPDATLLAGPTSTDVALPQISGERNFYGASASSSKWLGSAVQFEAPRATATGQYTRPKFHVGVPSESMRGWLTSAGLAADKCQLPMVRARTKSNGDGDINGTLWLYARCTFR